MRKLLLIGAASAALVLSACSGTVTPPSPATGGSAATTAAQDVQNVVNAVNASLPMVFKDACAGVSYADGAFKASSPALLIAGKINQTMITQEQAIFASAQATCENPPTDAASAGIALLGQASSIYLLLAGQQLPAAN